jgi:hypothetical protein
MRTTALTAAPHQIHSGHRPLSPCARSTTTSTWWTPESWSRAGVAAAEREAGHGGAAAAAGAEEMVVCSMRRPFKDSLKVLEADIQHANTL